MDDVKTVHDKDHPLPEPVIQLHDEPVVVVWGPKTTINHLADAMDKVRAWRKAKDEGASEAALAAILAAPMPHRTVLSPSALETSSRARTPSTIPAPPGEEVPIATKAPRVKVKLPKSPKQFKLKI